VSIENGLALLQVKDSGPGISVEERERVFDPFYRSLGTDEAGSGLGLSIVKAIADRVGSGRGLNWVLPTSGNTAVYACRCG
jgi:two-component system OmpR family sensor kinase